MVISSRPISVRINEPSVTYWGSLDTSPINSRIRFSSAIAPSSLDRVMTSPQAGQAKPVKLLGGLAVCVIGGEKKLPSKMCPAKHSHRLKNKSSSPVGVIQS